jgi:DNA-binding NarL/FixJ family response regulator
VSEWERRVLLVEDVTLMGSLIESFLTDEGYQVRRCTNAADARAVADEFDPDLAILDVNLGEGISGAQLGYILEQSHPGMAIMYLTQFPAALLSESGSAAHVRNKVVLNKEDVRTPQDLLHAIESALRGYHTTNPNLGDPRMQRLTTRQWEVLRMMAAGMTNTAIARRRGTSERAVEKQLKAIYQALEITVDELNNARVLATRLYLEATGDDKPV